MPKGKTPSRRPTSKKRKTSPERRVSRQHPLPAVLLETWQSQMRQQFESAQPFLLGRKPLVDLAILLPSRDAVVQIAEGLTALLRSLRP
jgi:hypothetical protein